MFRNKDNRFIVFIQTKDNQSVPPADNVSYQSLFWIIQNLYIKNTSYYFRSMNVEKDQIVTLAIYELTFSKYVDRVLEWRERLRKVYNYKILRFIINLYIYLFLYNPEVKYYGDTITNNKPKYLINSRDEIINEMTSRATRKIEFKWTQIFIDDVEIQLWRNNTKTREIFEATSLYLWEKQKRNIGFEEFRKFVKEHHNMFPILYWIKKYEYESFRRLISIKNEKINKEHWIKGLLGITGEWLHSRYFNPE